MSARPSPLPSTPIDLQVAGMNCISPWAPAELVWLLRPCPVSSMPMPASSVQGILYLSAAATYSSLIFGAIGSGGLRSEARRRVPGRGIRNPTPPSAESADRPSGAGDVAFLDGATAVP